MSATPRQRESSVFRKPVPPAAETRRGPDAKKGDRRIPIPPSVASSLPRTVLEQLAYLRPDQQQAFLWRYRAQAKSPAVAFGLLLLGGSHYLYVRRRGLQVLFWSTLGGLCVWWLADLVRIRRLIQDHNRKVAAKVMRALWG